jgi:NADH-quinone oxidoreductase subunit I
MQDAPHESRGIIALDAPACTSCMLCVRECPVWCIELDSHKETLPPETERGRPRVVNVLDRFSIDYGLCMWCGICVEVCPFDALFWAPTHEHAATQATALVHDLDLLGTWLADVPDRPAGNDAI